MPFVDLISAENNQLIKDVSYGAKILRQTIRMIDVDSPLPPTLKLVIRSTALLGAVRIPFSLYRLHETYIKVYDKRFVQVYYCICKIADIFLLCTQTINGLRSIRVVSEASVLRIKPFVIYVKVSYACMKSVEMVYKIYMAKKNGGKTNNSDSDPAENISANNASKYSHFAISLYKAAGRIVKNYLQLPYLGKKMIASANTVRLYQRLTRA